jgi:hypothetical protein
MADTNYSREHAASIFTVKMSGVRMGLRYRGRLQRRKSHPREGEKRQNPLRGKRKGERKLRHHPTPFSPKDRGGIFLRKIDIHLQNFT